MKGGDLVPADYAEVSAKVAMRCAALSHAGSMDPSHPEVGTGASGKSAEGEFVRIQLRVRRETILEARFKAFGCSGSIASASLASEWAEGRTLEEAGTIRDSDLASALELPAARRHCASLAEEALQRAILNYREKCRLGDHLNSIVSTGGSQ
ncbi:MAG: iron-sulfur cluster assembly scaffold protein [Acidobacteria bacterium]|nr:iron-sulfur cluster assembly scaffold protein [Acidobacteriota bacterium]